jgi:hypothetical protein
MLQSLAKVMSHVIFSTKYRTPWLRDAMRFAPNFTPIRPPCSRESIRQQSVIDGPEDHGVEDHVHIHCLLSRTCAIEDVIQDAKTEHQKPKRQHG